MYCETNDKRQFIVEMQMYWTTNFMQRVLFNSSKVYVSQMKQGDSFSNLQPIYSLNLIDDIFEPKMEEYSHQALRHICCKVMNKITIMQICVLILKGSPCVFLGQHPRQFLEAAAEILRV